MTEKLQLRPQPKNTKFRLVFGMKCGDKSLFFYATPQMKGRDGQAVALNRCPMKASTSK
jgi:hypothetical protein